MGSELALGKYQGTFVTKVGQKSYKKWKVTTKNANSIKATTKNGNSETNGPLKTTEMLIPTTQNH